MTLGWWRSASGILNLGMCERGALVVDLGVLLFYLVLDVIQTDVQVP